MGITTIAFGITCTTLLVAFVLAEKIQSPLWILQAVVGQARPSVLRILMILTLNLRKLILYLLLLRKLILYHLLLVPLLKKLMVTRVPTSRGSVVVELARRP